jgi:hypothetical protein
VRLQQRRQNQIFGSPGSPRLIAVVRSSRDPDDCFGRKRIDRLPPPTVLNRQQSELSEIELAGVSRCKSRWFLLCERAAAEGCRYQSSLNENAKPFHEAGNLTPAAPYHKIGVDLISALHSVQIGVNFANPVAAIARSPFRFENEEQRTGSFQIFQLGQYLDHPEVIMLTAPVLVTTRVSADWVFDKTIIGSTSWWTKKRGSLKAPCSRLTFVVCLLPKIDESSTVLDYFCSVRCVVDRQLR